MKPSAEDTDLAHRIADEFRAVLGDAVVRSVYLCGSRARGEPTPTSDIDVVVVVDGLRFESVRNNIARVKAKLEQLHELNVDAFIIDSSMLSLGVRPDLKESVLCFGAPLLESARIMDASDLEYHYAKSALIKLFKVRGIVRGMPLPRPLEYPDPSGAYLGYDRHGTMTKTGVWLPGMQTLLGLIAAIASYRLASLAQFYPRSKLDAVQSYQRIANDPWTTFVQDSFAFGRGTEYREAMAPSGRCDRMAEICSQVLSFENEFIELYLARRSKVPTVLKPSVQWVRDFVDRGLSQYL